MPRVPLSPEDLAARCVAVELLVLDVDGVLTDGRIILDDRGVESKQFYVRDGSAIDLWRRAGRHTAILSGRSAPVVARRAAELGISPVIQGSRDKRRALQWLLDREGLISSQACYVGDDLPDLPALALAGLSACPADAAPEVADFVHYQSEAPAGRGAVRDIIQFLLRQQGLWDRLVADVAAVAQGEFVVSSKSKAS